MADSGDGCCTWANGDVSLALFKTFDKDCYSATIFFEDFDKGMSGWSRGDPDSSAGYDYWGVLRGGSRGPPGSVAYCAKEGYNSVKNGKNEEILYYDKCMNASMKKDVDLRSYRTATLRYHLFYSISSDDYLADTYLMETIHLKFIVPHPPETIQHFAFIIEGHNWEKEAW